AQSLLPGEALGDARTLIAIFLGAALGYVIGGAFGRLTATTVSSVEQEFERRPFAEIAVGVGGVIVGLVIAFLVTLPLILIDLPPLVLWTSVTFIYAVLASVGFRIARSKSAEIYAMLGLKPKAVGIASGEINVIDTSVLIDGRVVDLVHTGFLTGILIIHSGVLQELQRIADASEPGRRKRGRRGLDNLAKLQKDPRADVVLVEEAGVDDVDAALVRLARERGGRLVTADVNLAKVAEAVGVPVRSINALAAAFRIPLTPGEELEVKLIKEGREHGQGIGYLEDGTMVVVEDSVTLLGNDVTVKVSNTLQTATGRMVFATLAQPPS
ncbi:MAG: TRAM domain-containing protein, partial [Actinomycetota bacterium]